jgi:hypothetical protein
MLDPCMELVRVEVGKVEILRESLSSAVVAWSCTV